MNSHDSKPQFSVDSFDDPDLDDIAQLFDAFEQDSQTVDPHLEQWIKEREPEMTVSNSVKTNNLESDQFDEDLLDLFDDNSLQTPQFTLSNSSSVIGRERITLSSLPSEEEISDLFGEFAWDSQINPDKSSFSSPELEEPDDELLALFEDDLNLENRKNIRASEPNHQIYAIKSLLVDEIEEFEPLTTHSTPPLIVNPVFYEFLEELADFLEKKSNFRPTYP